MNKVTRFLFFTFLSVAFSVVQPLAAQGTLMDATLNSKILGKAVKYKVYTPEGYDTTMGGFPVVYLLHGHGGSEKDWFTEKWGNMQHLLDSLIADESIPPIVAVTVAAGNSWYVDSSVPMESFYLKEFIPFIETQYRIDSSMGRTIAGDSAGGYGALRFSLLNPEMFEWVLLLSPAAYEPLPPLISSSRKVKAFSENGSFSESKWRSYSYTLRWETLLKSGKKPHYFLSTGDDDAFNIVPVVTSLQQQMVRDKIPCELRIIDGGHSWDVWRNQIVEGLILAFQKEEIPH